MSSLRWKGLINYGLQPGWSGWAFSLGESPKLIYLGHFSGADKISQRGFFWSHAKWVWGAFSVWKQEQEEGWEVTFSGQHPCSHLDLVSHRLLYLPSWRRKPWLCWGGQVRSPGNICLFLISLWADHSVLAQLYPHFQELPHHKFLSLWGSVLPCKLGCILASYTASLGSDFFRSATSVSTHSYPWQLLNSCGYFVSCSPFSLQIYIYIYLIVLLTISV